MMWILDSLLARKQDASPAIVTEEETLSFAQLWQKSECIARNLEANPKKTPIVIYGDKDSNIIPTMMAALKTGRAYVPVDITYPVERLQVIAQTVDASVIYNFSDAALELPFRICDRQQVCSFYQTPVQEDLPQSHWVRDEDDCYILFTSGSTGVPKGVPISKANILNFLTFEPLHQLPPADAVLLQASLSFDFSVEMLYFHLSLGRTLVCAGKKIMNDAEKLVALMKQNCVGIFSATPAFFDVCSVSPNFCRENLPSLTQFAFGGEVLPKATVRRIRTLFPNAWVLNTYGPTEATVEITGCVVTDAMLEDEQSIPIGTMMSRASYWIEAEDGTHCAEGQTGELVVVSKSVARGYYNNEEKTKACFFRAEDGRMGYRTGDLVYQKGDLLYFCGRKDFQIKLQGYRIEIEDVINHLAKVDGVQNCTVLPALGEDGKVQYLAGFVTMEGGGGTSALKQVAAIKAQLKKQIPSYMVPQKIFVLPRMPRTLNDKIDRKALAEMYQIKIR